MKRKKLILSILFFLVFFIGFVIVSLFYDMWFDVFDKIKYNEGYSPEANNDMLIENLIFYGVICIFIFIEVFLIFKIKKAK